MNFSIFIIFSLISCVFFMSIDEFPKENNIFILTNKTFDEFISKFENILIVFYAPWCGHCKKLQPELEKAASILSLENIFCAKVDATVEKNLSKKYEIRGFPTLKFFKNKIPIDYKGIRNEKEIINFARKASSPTTNLNSIEEVENIKNNNEVCIIYFGKNNEDLKIFKNIALKTENFFFGIVENEKIAKYFKANERSVVLFKKFDEKRNDFENINEKDLIDFIEKNSVKRIKFFDDETTSSIFIQNKPAIVYFGEKGEKWEKDEKILEIIAKKVQNKLITVMTEINEGMGKRVAERVGVKANDLPCIRLVENKIDTIKYVMDGNIEESNILNFIEKWENHLLKKYLKSQEEPKYNDGILFILVGKTYKKEVIDNDKDVMVFFYSSSSNESSHLLLIFEKVATIIKNKNHNIIFAKIDGSENEVDSVIIYGFPTIKFYPGNRKNRSPLEYRGDKNSNSIIKFIQRYAYNKIILDEEKNSDL